MKVIASQKREFLSDMLLFVIFGILIIGFMVAVCRQIYKGFQNPYYKNLDINIKENDQSNINEKMDFLIEDAEKWMQQLNYKNAAFQYKNALKIAPENATIEIKYIEAIVNQCYFDNTECELAHSLLSKAIGKYPDNPILIELKEILK